METQKDGGITSLRECIKEGQVIVLLRSLKRKFGNIPIEMEIKVKAISAEKLACTPFVRQPKHMIN